LLKLKELCYYQNSVILPVEKEGERKDKTSSESNIKIQVSRKIVAAPDLYQAELCRALEIV
jgi:hypothetical protein